MALKQIDPRTDPLWLKLLERYPSTVFHGPAWMNVLTDTYGFEPSAYVVVDDKGEPLAGVPFCVVEDVNGIDVISMPFSDFTDPLVEDEAHWNEMMEALLEINHPITVRALKNDIPRNDERFYERSKAKWHGIDLSPSVEDVWNNFSGSARRAVRKGEKQGVTVEASNTKEGMRAFFDMHLHVRKDKYHLVPQPWAFFEHIWERFMKEDKGTVMLAKHEGKVIGAVVFLIWENTLTYKFNASLFEYQEYRPNDSIIWNGIQWGKERGCTAFDFGLSDWDQEGLLQFKRKFASEEGKISFLYHVPEGQDNLNKGPIRSVFGQLTTLLTDESVPDEITEKAGEVLYRYFR